MINLTEEALVAAVQCPMRARAGDAPARSPVLESAEEVFAWLFRERFDGRWPDVKETLGLFDELRHKTEWYRVNAAPPMTAREGLAALHSCGRLMRLFYRLEAIPARHALCFPDRGRINQREVCRDALDEAKRALIIYLRDGGIRMKPLVPDLISFARGLDLID
jgi:hypothetical protein